MKMVQDIQRAIISGHDDRDHDDAGSSSVSSSQFPQLAGSHLSMSNPALEYIKYVTHVLALDSNLSLSVSRLKKNLLRLINVREFSEEAAFKDPCLSYILPDVTCEFCCISRDMDLLRDSDLMKTQWTCHSCGNPYNKNIIESNLVDIVQKKSLSYQLQDLVCSKCRSVKAENMGNMCAKCSGNWICKDSSDHFKRSLYVFQNVANYHKFHWLLEVVKTSLLL
eukprot:TRINITY_DN9263_c0_g1_i1.p1 TRINITY_DN9263_c0_g1~~TRINITY_DN9263_c0_g1_i1.p1  ORF type:complete len:245 (+),score=36.77 TRINITY_DN9263_c0_g1_i1:68-736(+)